ncbi:MAG TPA: lysylphosphatidylglycerol synthase transmembrane domain-containing protein [Oligoflexia bacterium]|nr:lysylphosphatidylglycerol synthase transmembrane domain-containing protein [Oligoflexia bacterium]HMP49630.1 lysylphosphatidylglycerol synthase transmembrane domain-containing protein [Oligoflexia bacterium]
MKSRLVLRFLLSLLLLGLIVYYVSQVDTLDFDLGNIDYSFLVLFIMITYPLIWSSSMKWRLFISGEKSRIPSQYQLMRFYTISYFANLFLPSSLGGDAARSITLGRHLGSQQDAFVATFLERLSGLLAMSILAIIALFLSYPLLVDFVIPVVAMFVVVGASSVMFFTSFGNRVITFGMDKLRGSQLIHFRLFNVLDGVVRSHFDVKKSFSLFLTALLWSFLFHFLTVVNTYFAAKVISWSTVNFIDLFVVVPLVLIVSMIPLSPGGIGIQEGAFVFLLVKIGASPSQALSVALLLRVKTLLLAGLGGVFLFSAVKNVNRK